MNGFMFPVSLCEYTDNICIPGAMTEVRAQKNGAA